jgi:hypothetical protein
MAYGEPIQIFGVDNFTANECVQYITGLVSFWCIAQLTGKIFRDKHEIEW